MDTQSTFAFLPACSEDGIEPTAKAQRAGTFIDNMSLPIHRWFRYSAGFSAEWAERTIGNHKFEKDEYVLDPFVGSGTTLLAAEKLRIEAIGIENHPFVYRIARAKLGWNSSPAILFDAGAELLNKSKRRVRSVPQSDSTLLRKCYTDDALCQLEALRDEFLETCSDDTSTSRLLWLAITSILRECSSVGTAQWQYVLPNKAKARVLQPLVAFQARIRTFCADMEEMKRLGAIPSSVLELRDSRDPSPVPGLSGKVRLVITSPPYPNNYDYADATRLEMTFWGELRTWGELQKTVRYRLIRSCSQHSAAEKLTLAKLLAQPEIAPIRDELSSICETLDEVRETKGGKKTYHTMIAAYFVDLARTWRLLRSMCMDGATVCFVIGDSAPYGIYVPVDRWLGDLAVSAGFQSFTFEKMRDRNIKWKNRKHRVPLKEGNLWVKG